MRCSKRAEVDSDADAALDRLQRAAAELDDDGRLPEEIHREVGALLLTMEQAIESPAECE